MKDLNLSGIVHGVVGTEAQDRQAQRELFRELVLERERLRDHGQVSIDFLLDIATRLLSFLADGSQPSLEDVQQLATRILTNVESMVHRHQEATRRAREPEPAAEEVEEPGLHLEELPPEPSHVGDVRLGDVLEALGLVTSEQLARALQVQDESKQRLGDILRDFGPLQAQELRNALDLREKARAYAGRRGEETVHDPATLPFRQWQETLLGEILVSSRSITREELEGAVKIGRATGQRLGEVLVKHGKCDSQAMLEAVRLQELLRDVDPTTFAADGGRS